MHKALEGAVDGIINFKLEEDGALTVGIKLCRNCQPSGYSSGYSVRCDDGSDARSGVRSDTGCPVRSDTGRVVGSHARCNECSDTGCRLTKGALCG